MNPEVPISHAQDHDLQRYVLGRLTAPEIDILERHLADCAECNGRVGATARLVTKILSLSRDEPGTNRRAEPRFHVSDVVFLRCLAPMLPDRWEVQIVDVSKNGLGLLAPVRLSPGVIVQVQSGTTFALGEIKHSRQINSNQFHIGIRVQDVVAAPWSPSGPPHRA